MLASGEWHLSTRATQLVNRHTERRVLDDLLVALRRGKSRALVLHGEPGIGKTALLEYVAASAEGFSIVRTSAVQSEMQLAFAGLHQLCTPMLEQLSALPDPQRRALETAFGLRDGNAPDAFLIGLAVLSLFSDAAQDRPLLCLIDDFQWMDYASTAILAFVARRLGSESVGMLFATRIPDDQVGQLSTLLIEGLRPADARALLDSVLPNAALDGRIRDQIVAETGGNPLALLELPKGLTPGEMAVGFELPGALPLTSSIEESFLRRIAGLPDQTRGLLLLAAAEPTGNPVLVWRAAAKLGFEPEAAAPATAADLATFDFAHPFPSPARAVRGLQLGGCGSTATSSRRLV